MKKPYWNTILGTGLGAGLIPVAPGTFGTLSAIPVALLFGLFGWFGIVLFIVLASVITYAIYPVYELNYGIDPGSFVMDEWAGLGISLLPVYIFGADLWIGYGLAFAFFRVFDISKVLGIDAIQNYEGANGVLWDDLLAGLYSAICLIFLIFIVL
ncbi:phosphatidylglycerophosphatase A [bacterium]|nr:MAG: phosphatidylglycerophosphatase A [bacterium]